MKVLVTGGAGFIGSHVCDALLEAGHEVIALDNLSGGRRENLDSRVTLLVEDIRTPGAAAAIERERPDAICHLASQALDSDPRVDQHLHDDPNMHGFINVLEAARRAEVKRVLFASTAAVYGHQDVHPATESHPVRPVSPYAVSKASGALSLAYYRSRYGLSSVSLRYANVYGPRQESEREWGVVATFAENILAGRPCTLRGDGRQTRDFIFVTDVARAHVKALESDYVGAINLGTGVETEIRELHRLLVTEAGASALTTPAEAPEGELRRSCVDPGLAAKVLNWKAEIALEQGLKATLQHFREAGSRKNLRVG